MSLRPASRAWGTSSGVVNILDGQSPEQPLLALIPYAFISSVDLKASYLLDVVSCLVQETDVYLTLNGDIVNRNDKVLSGINYLARSELGKWQYLDFVVPF